MERVLSTALATALVMTPAITVMAEEQDDLLAEKNDLEQKYADTVAQVVKVMKEFDSSGLEPLVKDTEEFLKEENDKTCEMLVYQELAKDWQGNKDKTAEDSAKIAEEIQKATEEVQTKTEAIQVVQDELESYCEEHNLTEKVQAERGYSDGMKNFANYANPDLEWQDEYTNYTEEQLAEIITEYGKLEYNDKKPLSLGAIVSKKQAQTTGDAFTAYYQEDGRVFYGYTDSAEGDPKDLVATYADYIDRKGKLKDELDKDEELRSRQKEVTEAQTQLTMVQSQLDGLNKEQERLVKLTETLDNLPELIHNLQDTMAEQTATDEAQKVHDTLAGLKSEGLITDSLPVLDAVYTDFGTRYNNLILAGQAVHKRNQELFDEYKSYEKQLGILNQRIAYEKELAKTKNMETQDKGIETGVITMNAVIPAIGAVGGLGLLALKRKKKKNG